MIGPVWIAGGTTEGRKLAGYAARFRVTAYVSVATPTARPYCRKVLM